MKERPAGKNKKGGKHAVKTCYGKIDPEIFEALSKIKLIAFDVDGTLTDGGIYLDPGHGEYKKFNPKDGLGISKSLKEGIIVAVITGRNSPLTERRIKELKITELIQGEWDKATALENLLDKYKLDPCECAVMGDDLNDLGLFETAGFSACPSDAHPYMQSIASLVLHREGGRGAARELCDLILMAQHKIPLAGGPW